MDETAVQFDLQFQYDEAPAPALQGVRGLVPRGQCVVLCGSSGCGKSTLLRCLNHLIPQFYEGQLKGFCRIAGRDLEDLSIGQTGTLAASVFQDPRSQFFTLNSSTEVAFSLENFGVSREEMHRRVDVAFERFHLQRLRDRKVFQLSSGERQLIAILSAWAMDTEVLLLDEPTANLDHQAAQDLLELLLELKNQGKTLLISEHRLSFLRPLADQYWRMEDGRIVERLTARQMADLSEQALADRHLRTTDPSRIVPCLIPAAVSGPVHRLQARQLQFSYGRGPAILSALSLEAETGQVIGLVGRNGCGKTTLGKVLAGLLSPDRGTVTLDGRPLRRKALSDQCMFVMQEAEFQFFTNSVLHELTYGNPACSQGELERLLKLVHLWDHRNAHPFSLSGGQMQKLVLLLACLSPKPVVVLDEPTAGLDRESLQACVALIREMQRRKLLFVITHDPELLAQTATTTLVLENGAVARTCGPGDFAAIRQALESPSPAPDRPRPPGKTGPMLDPRTRLLFLLVSMAVGVWTDLPLMLCTFTAVVLAALYERRWGFCLGSTGLLALLFGLYALFPSVGMSFVIHFFPRILLIGMAAVLVIADDQAPRTLAALRALHVPERIILVCSVTFRFFPVLSADLHMMHQSIRTRGFFSTLGEKLRALPAYLEVLLVPMVFRVIRIAEALSASAETRGIALQGRRSSYLSVAFGPADLIFTVLLTAAVTVGLIL